MSGELPAGEKLPSTEKIASLWKTSKSTAHTALNNLVKEGLLERHQGSWTYVREKPLMLARMGIYYDSPQVWRDDERAFYRSLQGILEEKLAKAGIEVAVFIDRRPEYKQRLVLSELDKAIFHREIQGLIIPLSNRIAAPPLLRLPLPVSIISDATALPNRVGFDTEKDFEELMPRLCKIGCKSVGLISSVKYDPDIPAFSENAMHFRSIFLRQAESYGLLTRNQWIKMPTKVVTNMAGFGYNEFHSLWRQTERPDAVLVYPDMVVRGVVTAALELNAPKSHDLTFCFHRNAHINILCPFPALWMVSDEAKIADALIDQVRRQHEGKLVSPARIPATCQMMQRTGTLPS